MHMKWKIGSFFSQSIWLFGLLLTTQEKIKSVLDYRWPSGRTQGVWTTPKPYLSKLSPHHFNWGVINRFFIWFQKDFKASLRFQYFGCEYFFQSLPSIQFSIYFFVVTLILTQIHWFLFAEIHMTRFARFHFRLYSIIFKGHAHMFFASFFRFNLQHSHWIFKIILVSDVKTEW